MTVPPGTWTPSATSLVWFAILHSLWLGTALAVLARRRGIPLALAAILPGSLAVAALHILILSHPAASEPLRVVARPDAPSAASRPTPTRPSAAPAPRSPAAPSIPDRLSRALDAVRSPALAAWSIGVLSHLGMLILGLIGSVRLSRSGTPAPDALAHRARRLCDPLGLARVPEVRLHPTIAQPCLAGLIRPRILLPRDWSETAPPEALDAVLAHELAHAARLDTLTALGQRLVVALFFYHPAIRRLERLARHGRELRADALAARLTGNPLALAEAIASVARQTLAPRRYSPSWPRPLVPGVADPPLRERIQEILGMTPQPPPRRPLRLLALLSLSAACAGLASTAGLAQDSREIRLAKALENNRPQHSMEFRVLTLKDNPQLVRHDGKPIELGPENRGKPLIIDDREILKFKAQGHLMVAPKITVFEGDVAKIVIGPTDLDLTIQARARSKDGKTHLEVATGPANSQRIPLDKREVIHRVALQEGSSLLLIDPTTRPDNRIRLLLVTPRHILTEAEEGELMKRLPDPPKKKRPANSSSPAR